jgi:cytochrome oxidase Cu insertion factor (SCO1/SenC/PrrC family)
MKRIALVLTLSGAAIALTVLSCNWRLRTRTPAVGEAKPAPEFSLPDHRGNQVSLATLVENGPAVVVFYRGHW